MKPGDLVALDGWGSKVAVLPFGEKTARFFPVGTLCLVSEIRQDGFEDQAFVLVENTLCHAWMHQLRVIPEVIP